MAERLDVAERLAEGEASVDHTQAYVRACHALGYGHPDLTAHPSQVLDWYDSEDGLDLRTLDRDCAELRAAGSAVTEALRIQRAQVAELAMAWTGAGGDAAVRFLGRHCDDGAAVAAELRAAAQRCEALRDNLWYLVDSKVATAISVDERTRVQRPRWLAAAATVTAGVGDWAAAEEVIRREVAPYVDEDIRHDWLTTMRSTAAGVATSYDMVIDRMAAEPAPTFESPGDLRPFAGPPPPSGPAPVPPPAAEWAPAAATPPGPPADPAPVVPAPGTAVAPAPGPQGWADALGDASGIPGGGLAGAGGGSGVGADGVGGLAGLAARIVDAIGGALSSAVSAADGVGGADPLDEDSSDEVDDPFEPEEVPKPGARNQPEMDDALKEADPVDHAVTADAPPPVDAASPPAGTLGPPDAAPEPPAGPAAPAAPAAPGSAAPAAPAPPVPEGATPCQIAADQLPQAG
ncbi:hypothetical protein [Mycobacterium sp. Marseille-P9652]|uniref:hypothetical protein n=1 Tax=Mycobacterium sp. Marseille-P9652 TaxID=2654950 RepID=UPI0012E96C3D|nr:hypothetical protein [Mycobacterium sp. Marseille-P9652]